MPISVPFGWLKLAVLGLFLAELYAGIGAGWLGLFSRRHFSPLARFGLGYLLGIGALGSLLFGLACAGLFFPSVIVLAVLAAFAVSWLRGDRKLLVPGALRELKPAGPGLLLLAIGIALIHKYLIPIQDQDSYIYHLGMPMQYLFSHRALLTGISNTMHFPLPVDITHVLALLLEEERLARLTPPVSFLAVCAVFADWCRLRGSLAAAWLGPLLAVSSGLMLELIAIPKNDVASAALFIAGALMWISRSFTLGALLLGFSLAAKMIYGLPIAFLITLHPPPFRGSLRMILCATLPILPWLVKNSLAVGSPLFPFFTGPFSALDWGEQNLAIMYQFGVRSGGGPTPGFAETALGGIRDSLLPFLLLPLVILGRWELRKLLLVCILGCIATLIPLKIPRYLLPSVWLLALLCAVAVSELKGRIRKWGIGIIAVLSLSNALYVLRPQLHEWAVALMTRDEFLAREFSTYEEAVRSLHELKPARVLAVGEGHVFRMPVRVIHTGQVGETPLIWKLAKESRNVRRLAIKFHQTGASHLLYNYISAEWMGARYKPFSWDERMLRLYVDYCKGHQEMVWQTAGNNQHRGGMVLYRIRREPRIPRPDTIWFAPGIEQIYWEKSRLVGPRKLQEYLAVAEREFRRIPDVGAAWMEVGYAYFFLKDYENAYRYLKEYTERGMLDEFNLVSYGISAFELGHFEKAKQMFREVAERCPERKGIIARHLRAKRRLQPGP